MPKQVGDEQLHISAGQKQTNKQTNKRPGLLAGRFLQLSRDEFPARPLYNLENGWRGVDQRVSLGLFYSNCDSK